MIVRLARCIGEYRRDAILAPVYVSLEVVMAVVIPLLMAQILDHGIARGNMEYIMKMGIALVVSTLLSLFFGVQSGNYAARASSGFAKNVRREMYHNVQNFSFSNIDSFSTASLVTRLTTDVANLQNAFQMLIRIFARSPLMLAFSLFAAIGINKKLSLVFLATIPFLGIGLYLIMSRAHPIFRRVFKVYDMLNSVVQENLRGIRVVKSYVREDFETAKFKNVSERIYREFSRAEKILAFNSPLMQFAIYTCMLLLSWFGAKMIVSDTMTTGQLMSLIAYTSQILMSLMMFSMVFVMVSISRASAERVVEVLNEKSDLRDAALPVFDVPDGSVRFEDVDFSYVGNPDKLCLKKIDLDIAPGETVGIIGETGSGKSTLVQLIPRLYDATSGKVCVGGTDVREYDLKSLRDAVAMVLQKNILFSGTIEENLRWGNGGATDEELVRVCELAQADGFIRGFPDGYDTYVEQGGANLSGGQKQRICIARALLKKPKILILDDSTSAVDMETDLRIRRALKEELPQTTKFIIAQRISSIEDADKIVVMNRGKIDAFGTHTELMGSSEIYKDVYLSQTKSGGDDDAA